MVGICPELSVQREKILLGLNFYGYDFTSSGMDREQLYDYDSMTLKILYVFSFSSNCWTQVNVVFA